MLHLLSARALRIYWQRRPVSFMLRGLEGRAWGWMCWLPVSRLGSCMAACSFCLLPVMARLFTSFMLAFCRWQGRQVRHAKGMIQ